MMLSCRICSSKENLKYSRHEVCQIMKKQRNDKQQVIKSAPNLGNICYDCDHRLRTYHQGQDSDVDEVHIDVDDSLPMRPVMKDTSSASIEDYMQDLKKKQQIKNELNIVAIVDLSLDSDNENEKENKINSKLEKNAQLINNLHSDKKREDANGYHKSVNRRKRKRYNESAFRLLASFSLVSSDSESEDEKVKVNIIQNDSVPTSAQPQTDTKDPTLCTDKNRTPVNFNNNNTSNNNNLIKSGNSLVNCDKCYLQNPDNDDKTPEHQDIKSTNNEKCPACGIIFAEPKKLVNHMRRKHRTYKCQTLIERPRCARDSAMTIRLRYQKRYIFYECQLCGRIDDLFKKHKAHILSEHALESKSLDDPLQKRKYKVKSNILHCPVCKRDCGTANLELIRHIVTVHKRKEYKPYVKEIYKFEKFKKQIIPMKPIKKTARVYKFVNTEHLFFQCRLCRNVELNCTDHINHSKTQHSKCQTKPIIKSHKEIKAIAEVRQNKLEKNQKNKVKTKLNNKDEKLKNKANKTIKKLKVLPVIRNVRIDIFNCKYCGISCTSFLALNKHLQENHVADEYFTCDTCSKSFSASVRLRQHTCVKLSIKQKHTCHQISIP